MAPHIGKTASFAALILCLALPSRSPAEAPIHVDEGRAQVSWEEASQVAGKVALVYGKVLDVRTIGSGITFVNFDSQRPARFAGVIFKDNLKNFPTPPDKLYAGKIVRLRGLVSPFKGNFEISISKPEQVEVLDEMPKSFIPPAAKARTVEPGELVVAAYNVLNLFDDVDDPYKADEGTPAKPRTELTALAQSIAALDADVIAMEEVENRDYLQRFVDVFLPDLGYRHVVLLEGNDGRGIDVALVSRIPVGRAISHQYLRFPGPAGAPQGFMRDVLEVELRPEGGVPFEAWVVHLKSNSGGREEAEPIRMAESRELRKLLDERLAREPETPLVVMGDFNDTWGTPTMETIVGSGPTALWSAGSEVQESGAVSYNEGEFRSIIDFMLCSPAMAKRYVKGTFHIPQGSIEATGSDHNPIAATFKMN